MSLSRRLFGGLVGSVAVRGPSIAEGNAMRASYPRPPLDQASNWIYGEAVPGPPTPRNPLLDAAIERHHRSARIRDRAIDLIHGYHPHVYSCKSWSPWFKASVSARKYYDRNDEDDSFFKALVRKFTGE